MNRGVKPEIDLSQIPICTPVMSQEQYSQLYGCSLTQVRSQVLNGNLPTYKIGRYALINIARLSRDSLNRSNYQLAVFRSQFYLDLPLMPSTVFSQRVGVSQNVVRGWINRGYIPSQLSGRDRVINVAQLVIYCMDTMTTTAT